MRRSLFAALRVVRRLLPLIALPTLICVPAPLPAAAGRLAQANCQLVLGFAALRDLVGADVVGTCVENQHFAANGDAQQKTTKGLLVWRKSDNWTAFTDGNLTWLNGPNGVQIRQNTDRFGWEPDAADVYLQSTTLLDSGTITTASGTYTLETRVRQSSTYRVSIAPATRDRLMRLLAAEAYYWNIKRAVVVMLGTDERPFYVRDLNPGFPDTNGMVPIEVNLERSGLPGWRTLGWFFYHASGDMVVAYYSPAADLAGDDPLFQLVLSQIITSNVVEMNTKDGNYRSARAPADQAEFSDLIKQQALQFRRR